MIPARIPTKETGMTPISRLLKLVPAPFSTQPAPSTLGFTRTSFAPGSDDLFVNAAVKSALLRAPEIGHAGIHVSTSRGVVQLSGFVASREVMLRAAEIARSVVGVRLVRNDMRRA
jgi:osmotically-inducible protein OsmY